MTSSLANITSSSTAFEPTDPIRPERLRGLAAGVIVGAVFGAAWAASAVSSLSLTITPAVVIVTVAIFGALMTGARRLRRAATAMPPSAAGSGRPDVRRRFTIVLGAEWAVMIGAANLLGGSGHSQWIPAVICAAVGLHFIPLARLFDVPLYYITAAAMCLVAATTMALGSTGSPATLWHLLPGFGAALTLWATSTGLLASSGVLGVSTSAPR